jgi:hypothetical protein
MEHTRRYLRVEEGDKNGEKKNGEEKHGSFWWWQFFYMMAVVFGVGASTSPWVELCLFSQFQK